MPSSSFIFRNFKANLLLLLLKWHRTAGASLATIGNKKSLATFFSCYFEVYIGEIEPENQFERSFPPSGEVLRQCPPWCLVDSDLEELVVSCLSRGAHAARLGHEEPISSCFRSSNCISGIGKTPCAEAKGEASTESCRQEDQEGERRPGNPFSIDFLKLTNFLLTKPHIFRCGNGKERGGKAKARTSCPDCVGGSLPELV